MPIFTNQATLSYNNTVTNSNVVTGEILEVLSATKTAVLDAYTAQDDITYVISIVNTGAAAFTGLTLTDNLGAYDFNGTTLYPLDYVENSVRYYINGVLQADPVVLAGPPLLITGINVPAGGNAILIYEAAVNRFAPLSEDGSITNEAVVAGGGITVPITVTETVTTDDEPVLSINKSVSPGVIAENGQLTYTFVIQNSGNREAIATDNAVVTDIFNPVLSNLSVTFNGVLWTEGVEYTYNETTGEFVTSVGQITVPAATFSQDPVSGVWITDPGVSVLTVTGTV